MSAHLATIKPSAAGSLLRTMVRLRQAAGRVNRREVAFRATAVLATTVLTMRAALAVSANPGRVTLLLVMVNEALTTALLLFSCMPKTRDTHPVALICVFWAYLYGAFLSMAPGADLIGTTAGTALCCAGMALTIWGKMVIGASFGLLPANRKVVCSGPYGFVRHPIYVGYFITHLGFVLSDFTLWNMVVLMVLYLCQIERVLREENVLRQDPAYRTYCRNVPYRFCYGLL